MLTDTAKTLARAIEAPLPPNAVADFAYTGADRLFLTTTRQSIEKGEALSLRAFVLSKSLNDGAAGPPPPAPVLHYRAMGGASAPWTTMSMTLKMARRGVFEATIPSAALASDIEYYVSWGDLVWPAGTPTVPHTVVVV